VTSPRRVIRAICEGGWMSSHPTTVTFHQLSFYCAENNCYVKFLSCSTRRLHAWTLITGFDNSKLNYYL